MLSAVQFERLGLYPLDVDVDLLTESTVIQRFVQTLVGVFIADILADDVHRHVSRRVFDSLDQGLPVADLALGVAWEVEALQDDVVKSLFAED